MSKTSQIDFLTNRPAGNDSERGVVELLPNGGRTREETYDNSESRSTLAEIPVAPEMTYDSIVGTEQHQVRY